MRITMTFVANTSLLHWTIIFLQHNVIVIFQSRDVVHHAANRETEWMSLRWRMISFAKNYHTFGYDLWSATSGYLNYCPLPLFSIRIIIFMSHYPFTLNLSLEIELNTIFTANHESCQCFLCLWVNWCRQGIYENGNPWRNTRVRQSLIM